MDNRPKEIVALEKAAGVNPEFAAVYGEYARLVPEFAEMKQELDGEEVNYGLSRRAAAEVAGLAFGKDGRELMDKTLRNNVGAFVFRMRRKVEQLLDNPEWLLAFVEHEKRENDRLAAEKVRIETEGAPKQLIRQVRQRFLADLIKDNGQHFRGFDAAVRDEKKMAAELFVSPTERVILGRKDGKLETASIENMVIDPAMITDTLLRNLGLEKFIPTKGTKKAKKLEMRAWAIPEIREKLGKLRTVMPLKEKKLAKGYYRTFADPDGYVLGTTNTTAGKTLFFTDLDSAVRRLGHIESNQSEEIAKLRNIQQVVRGVDVKLSTEWQRVKSGKELQKIKDDLVALVESLRYVTNKFKKEMLELLAESATLESTFTRKMKDGRVEKVVRLNPGAKRAKLNQVPVKVAERILEIERIKGVLAKDRVRMEALEADHQLIPFRDLKKHIEVKAVANKGTATGPTLPEVERDGLKCRIADWRRDFDDFDLKTVLQPYRSFLQKLGEKFELAEKALGSPAPVRKEVAEAVAQIYMVVKLQRFWNSLQKIYVDHLVERDMPHFVDVRNQLKSLKMLLLNKTVAPGIKTAQFDNAYHLFYKLLDEMIALAEEGRQAMKEKDEQKARDCKRKMYEAFKAVDIVKVVSGVD